MKKRTVSRLLTTMLSTTMVAAQMSNPICVMAADGDFVDLDQVEEVEEDFTEIEVDDDVELDEAERVELTEDELIPPTDVKWDAPGVFSFCANSDKKLYYVAEIYRDDKKIGTCYFRDDWTPNEGEVVTRHCEDYFDFDGEYTIKMYVAIDKSTDAEKVYSSEIPKLTWTKPYTRVSTPDNLHWESRDKTQFAVAVCDTVEHAYEYWFELYEDGKLKAGRASRTNEYDFSGLITDASEHEYCLAVYVTSDDLMQCANSLESKKSDVLTLDGESTEESDWYKDYEYTISDDVLVVTGYKGTEKELMIPAEAVIDGKKYTVEVDSLDSEEHATARDAYIKIEFGKGVIFGDDMNFQGMKSLEELDVTGVDTSNMTSMRGMFLNCFSLKKADLRSFNTENVTDMAYMFAGCYDIEDIDVSSFNTSKVENMAAMFLGCKSLVKINLDSFDTGNINGNDVPQNSYLSPEGTVNNYAVRNWMWMKFNNDSLYDSGISGMSCMFADCENLKELDLHTFETENTVQMYGMFMACHNLESINLSNFNTSNVVDMSYMFYACTKLKNLDLSGFNTANVKGQEYKEVGSTKITYFHYRYSGMEYMFAGCEALEELDLSTFDTSNVLGMTGMFKGCVNLNMIDLSSFDTHNVKSVERMFYDCKNLRSLDLSSFDLGNTGGAMGMYGAETVINFEKKSIFYGTNLVSLKTPKNIYNFIERETIREDYTDEQMQDMLIITEEKTEFIDALSNQVYTSLPYGEDSAVSHTLVRKDAEIPDTPDKPTDGTPTNTFSKTDAVNGIAVVDENHTLKLDADENGNFVSAQILNANGNVDSSITSYIANIVTEYDEQGNPMVFYSLVFQNGVWDTAYDSGTMGAFTYKGIDYFVAGGVVNQNANGLIYTGNDGWKFLAAGHVVIDNEGLVMYNSEWFWIDDKGSCDDTYAAIVKWNGADFLVHGGRLRTDYTGFTYDPQNTDIWYHITAGQVWGEGEITDISIEGGEITRNCVNGVVQ